jgi:hypothetical protein
VDVGVEREIEVKKKERDGTLRVGEGVKEESESERDAER